MRGKFIVVEGHDGTGKGTTSVKIADSTDLYFSSASVSLDFGATSDLGLVDK